MGDNVNRALTLGVGIFVTLILVSGIITIFTQMRDIYGNVNKSNTSLLSSFDEFSQYNYTEKTGLDKYRFWTFIYKSRKRFRRSCI